MTCETCIRWKRIPVHPRRPRTRPQYGWCNAPLTGKNPYWRKTPEDCVLTHQSHGEGCPAGKAKVRR